MEDLFDYYFYTENFLKIKTKLDGLQPFKLRVYQRKFREFYESINGPIRIYALKPRQAGFSTEVASFFAHPMFTQEHYTGLAMADKKGRTQAIGSIYKNFLSELPEQMRPMVALNNTEQILLDNPIERDRKKRPGLGSGILFETANDPNAGRSSPRKFAHLSEAAFYRYAAQIDEGVQNSIPLSAGTAVIKESTANGRAGIGKAFYDGYNAAKRGDSIYKAFFVSWYEIDDYVIPPEYGLRLTKEEIDIQKRHPDVSDANLMWRRMKILEYANDSDNQILTPSERFKQDFPLDDVEAFLSTGAPVFEPQMVDRLIQKLVDSPQRDLKDSIEIKSNMLRQFWDRLVIYSPPRQEKSYFIGADISEGLAIGDSSSAYVMDNEYNQVAKWHGKIDPDLFGHFLISLSIYYNKALIIPEKNNMGHTTVTTIRNEGYSKIYREVVEDKITKEKREELGWRTTEKSKAIMLNEAIRMFREGDLNIRDGALAREMSLVTREENGRVNLNGRDRVVALCLALMGRKQMGSIKVRPPKPRAVTGTGQEIHDAWEQGRKKRSDDIFG